MAEHLIEYVARDRTGITTVVTEHGVFDVDTVIRDIRAGRAAWYVARGDWHRAPVRIPTALGIPYLFANWDGSKRNNLHDLAFHGHTAAVRVVTGPRPGLRRALALLFGRTR